jgi:hypothetical protein
VAYLEESLRLMRGNDNHWLAGIPILYIGRFMAERGENTRSKALLEEASQIFSINGDRLFMNITRSGLADIARIECDYPRAECLYAETAFEWNVIGNLGGMARCLECLAFIAGELAKGLSDNERHRYVHRAGVLFGAADQLRKRNNASMMQHERDEYNLRIAAVRSLVDAGIFETALAEGQTLNWEESMK